MEGLGAVLEALGGVLEACGSVLEALGEVLEALEGVLKAFWKLFNSFWRLCWAHTALENENLGKHNEKQCFFGSPAGGVLDFFEALGASWSVLRVS